MLKVLFLIHDLGQGGAEKVLVNLVNNMDRSKFDITVMSLFGGGVNEQFLKNDICYKSIFKKIIPGNSKIMKMFSPQFLHKWFIKDEYDIEISYLEGPSARIISGCPRKETSLVSWVHVEQHDIKKLSASFRNSEEAKECYNRFHQTICVSEFVKNDFVSILDFQKPIRVLYNTVDSEQISLQSIEEQCDIEKGKCINLVAVGTLKESKGYMRLLRVIGKLVKEEYNIHLYILGKGPLETQMKNYIQEHMLSEYVTLLGYQTNPYKYVKASDLFVCASFAEGFSTAVTESLIIGTPVCTVGVSGMKELLGNNNEHGMVTENDENALYQSIKVLLDAPELLKEYRYRSAERGKMFSKEKTVSSVENMLLSLRM